MKKTKLTLAQMRTLRAKFIDKDTVELVVTDGATGKVYIYQLTLENDELTDVPNENEQVEEDEENGK